jgi:hypothetical protein
VSETIIVLSAHITACSECGTMRPESRKGPCRVCVLEGTVRDLMLSLTGQTDQLAAHKETKGDRK